VTSFLPYEIREAIIQACGKAFWYKDPLKAFLLGAGVPAHLYDKYDDLAKFKIARYILSDLDAMGHEGHLIQRRMITEFCNLRGIPDPAVDNKDAATQALRHLKELALAQRIVAEEQRSATEQRTQEARLKQAALAARAHKVEELKKHFYEMAGPSYDPQRRGYGLEDLLAELFQLHDITYRPPYRTKTEQIDGHFQYKGFDYLVEARWRKDQPAESDLSAFKHKVDKKITSTRGLFASIVGFRPEVVFEFTKGTSSNLVLMDGSDIILILEGQVSLIDALDTKIDKAAQEGIIFWYLMRVRTPTKMMGMNSA
jgi:hypothetical protein